MNLQLKVALLQTGKRQCELARQTGLSESAVSRIVNAYREPTPDEKRKIAQALGCAVEMLWPQLQGECVHVDG